MGPTGPAGSLPLPAGPSGPPGTYGLGGPTHPTIPSGLFTLSSLSSVSISQTTTIGTQQLGSSPMTFIIGAGTSTTTATANETLTIASGANATIENFSLNAGDKLDLTSVLKGAAVASDMSNLGTFVNIAGYRTDVTNGGTLTILSIAGPQGSATVGLSGSGPLALADLVKANALILPGH